MHTLFPFLPQLLVNLAVFVLRQSRTKLLDDVDRDIDRYGYLFLFSAFYFSLEQTCLACMPSFIRYR